MPTIKDVAKLAGVSITTVSMVLNKTNHKISDGTKKRVIRAAEEIGYRPNNIARSLATKKSKSIVLIIPDLVNPFFSFLSDRITMWAEKLGYFLYIYNSRNQKLDEKSFISLVERNYIQSALIVDRRIKTFDEEIISRHNIVFLDEFDYQKKDINIVTGNNEEGGYIATQFLIDRGFRNIGLNIGPSNTANSTRRLSGALKCMIDKGITYDVKNIFHGNYTYEGGFEAGRYFAQRKVDAIFSFSDMSSYGILEYFKKVGIRVPDDISLISYDNLFINDILSPKITSVDQNIDEIAKLSIQMIDDLLNNNLKEKKILVSPKIIERESVKEDKG